MISKNTQARKFKSNFKSVTLDMKFDGKNLFKFKNGDTYVGSYKIVFPDYIYRYGYGMYMSESDGSVYLGHWIKDKFIYGQIRFKNGGVYLGNFKYSNYHGKGHYKIPGVGVILTEFYHNRPMAEVVLVDTNGFYWYGMAENGKVGLYPANPFVNDPQWNWETSYVQHTKKNVADDDNKRKISFKSIRKTVPEYKFSDINVPLLKYLLDQDKNIVNTSKIQEE